MRLITIIIFGFLLSNLSGQTMVLRGARALDVDLKRAELTTNVTDYDNATLGDLVEVTLTEFNNLNSNLTGMAEQGRDNVAVYLSTAHVTGGISHAEGTVAANKYLVTFRYYNCGNTAQPSTVTGMKIKTSTNAVSGMSDYGNVESHSKGADWRYFVFKGNLAKVTSTTYVSVYPGTACIIQTSGADMNYCAGDCNTFTVTGHSNAFTYMYGSTSTNPFE